MRTPASPSGPPPDAGGGSPLSESGQGRLEAAFGSQYTVERLLGRGGMGAVYLARENALDRHVAIKVLTPDREGAAEFRERFRREARTAAKLTHPNIVPLHTFGESGGVLYFVMGFVRGETLSARMRRPGGVAAEEAVRIAIEVADALDYAHGHGIVHRDVKPDNVLLDEETGRALLADFGVARAAAAGATLTAEGSIVGTPHYMSPEQASGRQDVDGRSDIYALGVMAYAMLAGRLPFDGKTAGEILAQHLTREPPPLAPLAKELPAAVAAAVMRCLAKDPAARWPDAKSLRDALRAATPGGDPPEPLQGLDVYAQWLVGATVAVGFFKLHLVLGGRPSQLSWFLHPLALIAAFVAAAGIARRGIRARRHGFRWPTILATAFQKPTWWVGWYPARLRLPGDVWDRLPPVLRRGRILATLWLALVGIVLPLQMVVIITISEAASRLGGAVLERRYPLVRYEDPFHAAVWTAVVVLTVASIPVIVSTVRWLRRVGLDEDVTEALITPTTWRPFWARPKVAALLQTETAARPRTTSTPAEMVRAITAAAERLDGEAEAAARHAAEAARRLLSAFEAADLEHAALEADADPAEEGRLAARLDALGPEAATEGEARRQMRELMRRQLELVRALPARIDAVAARRRALAGRLEELRTAVEQLAHEQAPMSRMRALCAYMEPDLPPTVGDEPTRAR